MPEEGYKFVASTEPAGGDPPPGCSWPEGPEPQPEFTGAVLMCPVCVSTIDAVKWGWQQHTCPSCSTEFAVDLRPDVVAEHAMVG